MRKTTSKGRKPNNEDLDEQSRNNSGSLQMELELLALKAKNSELTRAHAKVVHENCEMKNEILALRRELVDVEAKCNTVEAEFNKLAQGMKKCTPSLVDILNLFLKVTERRSSQSKILGVSNCLSDIDTPKAKVITHTVKPHTVNGTVLNLTPTISLTRLNPNNDQIPCEEPSSSTNNIDNRNSLPSTSSQEEEEDDDDMEELEDDNENENNENEDFVLRKSHVRCRTSTPLVTNPLDPQEMEGEDEDGLEDLFDNNSQEFSSVRRLTTIHEESVSSTNGKSTSLGEIRIYLSRLSANDTGERKRINDSGSSIEANVNDTCLNIETTVIENQEARVSKRLRADIMVFSPHTNSTRLEGDNSMYNNLSQSIGLVPTSSTSLNQDESLLAPVPLNLLPTPSMSAMGDIDKSNYSKLDILAESQRKLSPIIQPATPPRNTRSKKERQTGSEQLKQEQSPVSSRDTSRVSARVTSFVTRHRGGSGDVYLSPTIVLERVEIPRVKRSLHRRGSPMKRELDDPKESENIPNNTKQGSRKASKKKDRSMSPKRSVKRKKTNEAPSLQDKIMEVQIRLSNFAADSSTTSIESPSKPRVRPSRAAKPTSLKDASLKGKLRRMF